MVIQNHDTLTNNEDLIPILEEKQQEAIEHFVKTIQIILGDIEGAIRYIRKIISIDLKKRNPHSPHGISLYREQMYK